jgi:hypothetical protein
MTRKRALGFTWAAAITLMTGLGLGASLMTSTAHAKSCVMAGGEATMITPDLAKFMAEAALKNSMKDRGLTPVGGMKMACQDPAPFTHCLAKQRACK